MFAFKKKKKRPLTSDENEIIDMFYSWSVIKGKLLQRKKGSHSEQIKKCVFLSIQVYLYFYGKMSRQKYFLRHNLGCMNILGWISWLCISPWLALSFHVFSVSLISLTGYRGFHRVCSIWASLPLAFEQRHCGPGDGM